MEALMDSVIEVGYEPTSMDDVAQRAGVDPAAWRRHFEEKADCYAQTYRRNFDVFSRLVFGAFEAEDEWRDGLRASAYAAARYLRDYDREVRFGVIPALGAGGMVAAYRDTSFQRIVDLIDLGRQQLDDPDSMGRGAAEATLGAIYGQLVKRLGESEGTGSAEDFVPELMYIAVRPYLGHEVAREELAIPPPPESGGRR
jgi:AcrR family transcriptional regulator